LNSSIPESLLKVIFDLSLVYNYTYYDGIMFQAVREALPAITPSLTRSDDSVSSADPCTLFLSLFPLPSKKKKKANSPRAQKTLFYIWQLPFENPSKP
jgi:hypothetical protein